MVDVTLIRPLNKGQGHSFIFGTNGFIGNQSLLPNANSADQLALRPTTSLPTLPYQTLLWSIAAYSVDSLVLIDSRQKFGW